MWSTVLLTVTAVGSHTVCGVAALRYGVVRPMVHYIRSAEVVVQLHITSRALLYVAVHECDEIRALPYSTAQDSAYSTVISNIDAV